MFIHLPNTSKQRATGSPLTPGARSGRCSKIINSNACFSVFPLKFQGLLTPPPNSSMQKHHRAVKPAVFRCSQRSQKTWDPAHFTPGFPAFTRKSCSGQPAPAGRTGRDPISIHFRATPGERSMLCKRELENWSRGWGTHVKAGSFSEV